MKIKVVQSFESLGGPAFTSVSSFKEADEAAGSMIESLTDSLARMGIGAVPDSTTLPPLERKVWEVASYMGASDGGPILGRSAAGYVALNAVKINTVHGFKHMRDVVLNKHEAKRKDAIFRLMLQTRVPTVLHCRECGKRLKGDLLMDEPLECECGGILELEDLV